MEIRFKNRSRIETIETDEETKRSIPKEFYVVDIKSYLKRNPLYFIELQGIKLHWWQKLFFRMSLNKLKFYNKIIK